MDLYSEEEVIEAAEEEIEGLEGEEEEEEKYLMGIY
jgi:hypothetical protein